MHSYGVKRVDGVRDYKISKNSNSSAKKNPNSRAYPTTKALEYQRINMNHCMEETCCSCGGDQEEERCYHRFHNKAFCVTILSFFFLIVSAMLLCYTYMETDWKVIRAPAAALMGLWLFVFLITGLVASQLQVIAGGVRDCLKSLCYCCCKQRHKDEVQDDDLFQNHGLWHHERC